MSNISVVFDACSVINIIHFDSEDEYLIKKLSHLEVHICDCVYKEVVANAFTIPEEKERIAQSIATFLPYKITDNQIIGCTEKDFYENVKLISGYKKENGEFYSTALSLYLSQSKPTKLFFYTDDYTAIKDFKSFYHLHQIGGIKDTADLLLLLYRLDDNFSKTELLRLLSSLFSKYTTDITMLLSKLRQYSIPKTLLKDRNFNDNYRRLIYTLDSFSFEGINEIREFFLRNRNGRYSAVVHIINQHKEVFNLESHSNEYLVKIKDLIGLLKSNEIYKIKIAC